MRTIALLLSLLLQSTPPPPFTATWQPYGARIAWTQPAGVHLTCLRRDAVLIRCWTDAPPGLYVVELGATGPLDGNMRPAVGDVFALEQDGVETRAPLVRGLWMPIVRQGESRPRVERLWLAAIRR